MTPLLLVELFLPKALDGCYRMRAGTPSARKYAHFEHTKSAHTSRRKLGEKIQSIIEKRTYALWKKKPRFLGNKTGTAKRNRKAVMLEIETTSEFLN